MGQYHYVVNFDRKEYLHPHRMGDGLKLLEFGDSSGGTMCGLALLLAVSNDRGGGDLHVGETKHEQLLGTYIIGRWGGDRIAIVGDYHEPSDLPGFTDKQIAETGGYSGVNAETREAEYENPVMGDVPWNQDIKRGVDLGWTDISDVVIEAMKMDSYLKGQLEDPKRFFANNGSRPISALDDEGRVIRLIQNMREGE